MTEDSSASLRRQPLTTLLVIALVGVLAGLAGWSARTLFAPPEPLAAGASYTVVEVTEGQIERGLNLNVSAAWSGGPTVVNGSSGTLTEMRVSSGSPVESGVVLYSVDLSPVVLAQGPVPAFRDLSLGARGADVRQLQELLRATGHEVATDGRFGAGTARAVRAWQRELGIQQTGTVPLGAVIFVPTLPGLFAWQGDIGVGAALSPGMAVGRMLPAAPVFTMTLPANQRSLVTEGMPVTIFAGDEQWESRLGVIGEPGEDGSAAARVEPAEGAQTVCGDQCMQVPIAGDGALRARVTVIPRQDGTLVPTAALAVAPDGTVAVVAEDGTAIPVQVQAVASGQALVSGVQAGERIRVPAEAAPATSATTPTGAP